MSEADGPTGYRAALIALLSLRGSLPGRPRLAASSYRIDPDPTILSADQAARVLTSLPKPLGCFADVLDGIVHIRTEPLANPQQLQQRAWRSRFNLTHGTLGHMLSERYGQDIDSLLVAWIGGGQRELVSMGDVAEFHRDYECSPYGGGAADWIDSEWARAQGVALLAANGAVAGFAVSGPVTTYSPPRWLARLLAPVIARVLRMPRPRDA